MPMQRPSPQQPYQPPPPAYQPPPPAYQPPPPARPPLAPVAGSNAPTMFAGGPPPAAGAGAFNAGGGPAPAQNPGGFGAPQGFGAGGPMAPPVGNSPHHASSVPLQAPTPIAPVAPIPSASPPYLANQAARAGRPIEPWKDSLRLMMFVWGGVLLAAFATPLSTDPLAFNWDIIANAEGTMKLPPLIMAAVGILSLAIAGIPMSPAPRGMIAALLGLSGVLVPTFLAGMPPWQMLVPLAGMILLIPSLFVRHEYRDASLPRILITVGVVALLVPLLIPVNGSVPLVEVFKGIIDAPGKLKVIAILQVAYVAIVVLSLLAWMPAPSSGGAKVFAWLLILWPVVILVAGIALSGDFDVITKQPAVVVGWVYGGGKGAGLGAAYAVLIGYGLATVIGKKLE
jgi:hypothetical protein